MLCICIKRNIVFLFCFVFKNFCSTNWYFYGIKWVSRIEAFIYNITLMRYKGNSCDKPLDWRHPGTNYVIGAKGASATARFCSYSLSFPGEVPFWFKAVHKAQINYYIFYCPQYTS